jgi:hypothetical protein
MNIFFLDENPALAAQYHADRHVVKMILESAQLICTALHEQGVPPELIPYKPTHRNHPCAIWARETKGNLVWLYPLMMELNDEWKYRFDHEENHKSVQALEDAGIFSMIWSEAYIPNNDFERTKPALAMPDYCKIFDDPVKCYRYYYKFEKTHLHKWTSRKEPYWI